MRRAHEREAERVSDTLDQSDIDQLLAGLGAEPEEQGQGSDRIYSRRRIRPEPGDVSDYDFKRPERVSKDQMRALQTLHEGFARNFGASLSGYLRTIVEIKVAACGQMTYYEFVSGLPNPTSFNLIESDMLDGQICLEIAPLIVYPIIDRLLGGSTRELFIPQRPVTQIEERLVDNVIQRALHTLSEAWENVRPMKFETTASESNPQLVQIVPPNEVVVVISFEIKLSNRAGTMNLCIPYNVIEPVMEELSSQNWFSAAGQRPSAQTQARITHRLREASVGIRGLLARTTISMRDLVNMSVGDVILTETRATDPVTVMVEDEPTYFAALGQHRDARALRVTGSVEASTEPGPS